MRSYLLTLTAFVLALLGAIAAFQLGVDGLGLFGTRLVPESVFPDTFRIDAGGDDRMVKALEIAAQRGERDMVFVGSSRVQFSFDPQDFPGVRSYNAAARGGRMVENSWIVREILARGPKTRRIVWNVDFWEIFGGDDIFPDEKTSPFLHPHTALSTLRLLFSYDMVRRNVNALERGLQGKLRHVYTTDGFLRVENAAISAPVDYVAMPSLRNYLDKALFSQRARFGDNLARSLAAVRAAVEDAKARGVDVDLIMLPEHAARLALYQRAGLSNDWGRWKAALAETVAQAQKAPGAGHVDAWDFTALGPVNTQTFPPEKYGHPYFFETLHVRASVAKLVFARLTGAADAPAGFGHPLRDSLSEAARAKESADLAAWMAAHPQEMAEIDALVAHYSK